MTKTARIGKKRGTPKDALVGARIRAARSNAGMALTKLAALTGISYQQIGKYEHGVNRVGPDRLQRIATATNHPINFFFEDIGGNAGGGDEVKRIIKLMGASSALRRIIAGLPRLNRSDAKLVAGVVERLAGSRSGRLRAR